MTCLTEEACAPDVIQQGALEVTAVSRETVSSLGECPTIDKAASAPAGTQAKMQIHPADVLGYALEMQLAEGELGRDQPAASIQESPEKEQLPWLEAAQASETFSWKACTDTISKDSLLAQFLGVTMQLLSTCFLSQGDGLHYALAMLSLFSYCSPSHG